MRILGLNLNHISSAALLEDGEIIAAACEERFSRNKMTRDFPVQSIEYVLKEAGLVIEEIDAVSVPVNPSINLDKYRKSYSSTHRWLPDLLYSIPNNLFQIMKPDKHDFIKQQFMFGANNALEIYYLNHHRCHASASYYLSRFDSSAVFSFDGFGERTCTMWASVEQNRFQVLQDLEFPQSIGSLYESFTDFLGFQPDADEWKIMGMAAYGDPGRFRRKAESLVELQAHGKYELDLSYFNFNNFDVPGHYTSKLIDLLGEPRSKNNKINQRHFDLAATAQELFEKLLFHCVRYLHDITGESNLCLSGGSAMNSLANGKIQEATPFDNVFIPYAPDDSGLAIGSALHLYHEVVGHKHNVKKNRMSYLGPEYSDKEIKDKLTKLGISFRVPGDIADDTVKLLIAGKVVAWFQGRMEFGQRALGNRSILADPRKSDIKSIINSKIKYRESFRPFAPAVLKEEASSFFQIDDRHDVKYMEAALPVKPEKLDLVPGVVHRDGTGRLQTVDEEDNPKFYRLIKAFQETTGIPMLVNTSFNVKGEPIVCTPEDALRTFHTSGLDALVIGKYIIEK